MQPRTSGMFFVAIAATLTHACAATTLPPNVPQKCDAVAPPAEDVNVIAIVTQELAAANLSNDESRADMLCASYEKRVDEVSSGSAEESQEMNKILEFIRARLPMIRRLDRLLQEGRTLNDPYGVAVSLAHVTSDIEDSARAGRWKGSTERWRWPADFGGQRASFALRVRNLRGRLEVEECSLTRQLGVLANTIVSRKLAACRTIAARRTIEERESLAAEHSAMSNAMAVLQRSHSIATSTRNG